MFSLLHDPEHRWADALATEDGSRREAARSSLVTMGSVAVPILCELMEDPRFLVKWEAALVLKELALPGCVDPLLEALKDEEGDVRWVAAEGLGAVGLPGVRPLLFFLIDEADSFGLRDAAHVAISLLDDEETRSLLMPLYHALVDRSPPEVVIAEARRALDALDGMESGPDDGESHLRLIG